MLIFQIIGDIFVLLFVKTTFFRELFIYFHNFFKVYVFSFRNKFKNIFDLLKKDSFALI